MTLNHITRRGFRTRYSNYLVLGLLLGLIFERTELESISERPASKKTWSIVSKLNMVGLESRKKNMEDDFFVAFRNYIAHDSGGAGDFKMVQNVFRNKNPKKFVKYFFCLH